MRLIVALLFATNLMAQNVPNYVPTNGLVGYWPFNGNVNDESGNGNHGTVNGAMLTEDRENIKSRAYQFGVEKWITINDHSSLRSNIMTISAWVKIDGPALIDSYVGGFYRYPIFYKGEYEVFLFEADAFHIKQNSFCNSYNGTGWVPLESYQNSYKYDYNQWHFVVGIFDGSSVKLYIDNVLIQDFKTNV